MKGKLPKINKQKLKELKTKVQNDYYYRASSENKINDSINEEEIKELDRSELIKKINNILNSREFIYQADVNIIYKNGKNINKKVIGFIDDYILTKEGDKISINDIKNIK
ncbi:MAG: hypothetical protein IJ094_01460 [Bacilli bacterium]|nr:hypothetical protein [Bacilli bacterium]